MKVETFEDSYPLSPMQQGMLFHSLSAQPDGVDKVVCMHQVFEAQVKRTPDAVAVLFEDEQLTYRELNCRANCLAHYLQSLGVGPEVLVGICMERSLEMVVGLFGILKAGGAYVFLDPAYPKERLTFMLEETMVPVLLTQHRLVKGLPARGTRVAYLDTDWETIAQESESNPASVVTAQNLAYVMYTSGSTGRPKGVTITHANVQHYVQSINAGLQINPDDVYLHMASFSFASSVRQLMVPLSQGAKVLIATYEQTRSPLSIFNLIQKRGVTVCDTVQSFWQYGIQALEGLEEASRKALLKSNLRLIVFCGELLTWGLPKTLLREFEYKPLMVNLYALTETTSVCNYPLPSEFDNEVGPVPVGRPVANVHIYILNSQLQPVPVGVPGELHVGGAGLARGYLHRSDLTNEKFISNPFSDDPAARIHKTGDLARYLPSGDIEILGRIDDQVQLRGMRVELGEIEAVIGQHAAVRQSVVIAREDGRGDKCLVAYIVPHRQYAPLIEGRARSKTTALTSDLRRCLKEYLPDYMIPSAFVLLEALPLTPNGKVDRRALPNPEGRSPELEAAYVAPRTEVEQTIAAVWEELLHVEKVGIQDNFFELGGHSLLAVRLFAQIQKIFDLELPLATLFQAPTIEQLASRICQSGSSAPISSLVKIQSGGSKPPFFGVHGAGDGVFVYYYYNLIPFLGPDQPIYGLQPQGLDGLQLPHSRIEDMAAHYIREIRTIQPVGPYFLGGASLGGKIVFEMAQQLHAQGEKVAMLVLFDTHGPKSLRPLPVHVRASRHLANLLRLELKQKLTYVQKRLAHRFDSDNRQPLPEAHLNSPLHQAINQANRDYVPQVYPGRAILFRVSERPVDLSEWLRIDPELGWGSLVAGGLEIQDIPGNHYNMFTEPHVPVLAEKLKACLDSAQVDDMTPSPLGDSER